MPALESRLFGTIESGLFQHWVPALDRHIRFSIWINHDCDANFPVDVCLVCQRWIDGLGEVDQNSVPLRCIQVRGCGRGLLCKSAYVRATRYCQ